MIQVQEQINLRSIPAGHRIQPASAPTSVQERHIPDESFLQAFAKIEQEALFLTALVGLLSLLLLCNGLLVAGTRSEQPLVYFTELVEGIR